MNVIGKSFKSLSDVRIRTKTYTVLEVYEKNQKTYVKYEYSWSDKNGDKKGIGVIPIEMIWERWYETETGKFLKELLENQAPEPATQSTLLPQVEELE